MEISSTTWRDWDTGRETDFAEVNCGAFYFDGTAVGSTNSACLLGGGSGETTASAANATEGCKNALASICYTVSACASCRSGWEAVPRACSHVVQVASRDCSFTSFRGLLTLRGDSSNTWGRRFSFAQQSDGAKRMCDYPVSYSSRAQTANAPRA